MFYLLISNAQGHFSSSCCLANKELERSQEEPGGDRTRTGDLRLLQRWLISHSIMLKIGVNWSGGWGGNLLLAWHRSSCGEQLHCASFLLCILFFLPFLLLLLLLLLFLPFPSYYYVFIQEFYFFLHWFSSLSHCGESGPSALWCWDAHWVELQQLLWHPTWSPTDQDNNRSNLSVLEKMCL